LLRAAIFDLDGLLVDSEPLWQAAEIEVFGGVGLPLTREDCWRTKGLRIDAAVRYWFERCPWPDLSVAQVESRVVGRVLELLRERAAPKRGARHAIDFFRASGLRLAVASSSAPEIIAAALAALQMQEDFEAVRSAVLEAEGKPHPAVYLATAAALGIAPEHCVALEDSRIGVAAARAAGMLCIAVPDTASGPPGEARDFEDDPAGAHVTLPSLERIDDTVLRRLEAVLAGR
jgi:sugar-phosphatase